MLITYICKFTSVVLVVLILNLYSRHVASTTIYEPVHVLQILMNVLKWELTSINAVLAALVRIQLVATTASVNQVSDFKVMTALVSQFLSIVRLCTATWLIRQYLAKGLWIRGSILLVGRSCWICHDQSAM